MSFLDNLHFKLKDKMDSFLVPVSFWGSGACDNFLYNYDFFSYEQGLVGIESSEDQPPQVLVVSGPVNKKQLEALQDQIREGIYVVLVTGPVPSKYLAKSGKAVADLRNHIRVDYEYSKYPVDIPEFIKEVNAVVRGKHD